MDDLNSAKRMKSCSKCNTEFHCKPQGGCWCENIILEKDTLKELFQTYDNCLCEPCLTAYEREQKQVK